MLSLVDLFIAPVSFYRSAMWTGYLSGQDRMSRTTGRTPPAGTAPVGSREHRNRFRFFGQLTPIAQGPRSGSRGDARVDWRCWPGRSIRGTRGRGDMRLPYPKSPRQNVSITEPTWIQPGSYRERMEELLAATAGNVHFVGKYDHDQLPDLMANIDWVRVPSLCRSKTHRSSLRRRSAGRPVLCSDIRAAWPRRSGTRSNEIPFPCG